MNTAASPQSAQLPSPSGDETPIHEAPLALVQGLAVNELPKDLYIPPDALRVILDAFTGPLDLLLYLIKRQNLDILSINVAAITQQYVQYVEMMEAMQFELAAEYLVMAAMLAEIKSRTLLPLRQTDEDREEEDPRAALIRRLQEYERFKQAAEDLDALPRQDRDTFSISLPVVKDTAERPQPKVELEDLLNAMTAVLHRADLFSSHQVAREPLSTRERMAQILHILKQVDGFVAFGDLLTPSEGRPGVIVTFIALMELIKEAVVDFVQRDCFGVIHVRTGSV